MSSTTLPVDRYRREVFNEAAIAAGMGDTELALSVCRKLVEVEQHYDLVFRRDARASATSPASPTGDGTSQPSGKPIRIASKFAGSCRGCGTRHAEGEPVWWARGIRGVTCDACGAP